MTARLPPEREPTSAARASLRTVLRYDPTAVAPPDAYAAYDPGPRTGLTIALALLEGGVLALALLVVSFAQASSPAVAIPAHERVVAALAEIDALVALRGPDLQSQLEAGTDPLVLADFPVRDAAVARAAATDVQGALKPVLFREALLDAAATLIYERGPAALSARPSGDPLLEALLSNLTRGRHAAARLASAAALVVTVVLTMALVLAARHQRWLALGAAVTGTGALVFVVSVAGSVLVQGLAATTDGALRLEEVTVIRALLDVPLRNGVIAGGLGLALLVASLLRGSGGPSEQAA